MALTENQISAASVAENSEKPAQSSIKKTQVKSAPNYACGEYY
jgi:hypothetical protein